MTGFGSKVRLMSRVRLRVIGFVMAAVWLIPNGNAQTSTTFSGSDGTYRFSYPSDFQICTKGNVEPCLQTYIPICSKDALVCAVYPAGEFKGTNFSGASFEVRVIVRDIRYGDMTADKCVTPTADESFLISAEHPTEMIGGVRFIHGSYGAELMSQWYEGDLYRAFHDGQCFELILSKAGINPDGGSEIKMLTPTQEKKIDQAMSQILHSFRFTN